MKALMTLACLAVVATAARAGLPEGTNDAHVRIAVARSLPWIEKHGVAWMSDRGCVTCHQVNFLVWTHREAARRGFDVDGRKTEEWTLWTLLKMISGADGGSPQGSETFAQAILARDERSALTAKPRLWNRTVDPYENVFKNLLKEQKDDGQWAPGGQAEYPAEVSTGWALYAIGVRDILMKTADAKLNPAQSTANGLPALIQANNEAVGRTRERALAWLKQVKEDPTKDLNEQLVVRLLVSLFHGDEAARARRRDDLLARQNADGGWSANPALQPPRGSDAFATGMSLYALMLAGVDPAHEAVVRARSCLMSVQEPDGSWKTPTAAVHKPSGNPERDARTDDVYQFWATTWAALGLMHTLPQGQPAAPPSTSP